MPDTTLETILYTVDEHVCTITLNRPDVFNAFNDALTGELTAAFKQAAKDADVRAIILTGAGKAFSSGQDLADLRERYKPGYVPQLSRDLRKRYNPIITTMTQMPKPIIAAVNGVAAGAGCSLALACDMRLAGESAAFMEVFVNVGLIPDSGSTWFLPRLVGSARAFELCCTGRKVSAEEAEQIGLINAMVDDESLMDEATARAQRLAALPGRAIALTKRLLNQASTNSLTDQLEAEAFDQDTAGKTADHMEGVMAFLEKRKPSFTGK
jgi:2-(1,2-epoxy-1,2-dihydrophenyl)acetyl-CoA isomerase